MTITTGASFRPDIWSKEINKSYRKNLVLGDKVSRFDQEVATKGKAVLIPSLSELIAVPKVANTEVVLQSPTETTITLNMDQHYHTAFVIEDILATQSSYNLMAEYTDAAGYAVKKAFDTAIANLATGFSQSAGTYNTTLATSAILAAVQALDDADVPQEDRTWVMKPHAINDLRTIADYTRYDGTGYAGAASTGGIGNGQVKPNGLVGMLYNAPVYMTTNIAQSGNNISNMYFHKNAIAAAMQKNVRVQSDYKLEHLGTLVVADTIFGVVERRDAAGVEVRN